MGRHRRRLGLVLSAAVTGLALVPRLGTATAADPPSSSRPPAGAIESPAPAVAKLEPRVDSDASTYSACAAPSVIRLHGADDAMDPDVATCGPRDGWSTVADREQGMSARCDAAGRPGVLERALSGALPLDDQTLAHVRDVFRAGQAQGRRPSAFGLVGDSMTVEGAFMRPFAVPVFMGASVRRALLLSSGTSVVDYFRDAHAADSSSHLDSFVAPRAAKVGVRAGWALSPQGPRTASPLEEMVATVSPAFAVVLYGANDAVWTGDTLARRRTEFVEALSAIADGLEYRGVIPILTTIPKHMRYHGWPDCPVGPAGGANERFAAQATALSAAVADLACRRHLPLIDLRWSLDPLVDHGIGPDGVHLSVHPSGGAVLDAAGLQCGYNVRNLVTLKELARVVDAVSTGVW